jgi:hypothetical protein
MLEDLKDRISPKLPQITDECIQIKWNKNKARLAAAHNINFQKPTVLHRYQSSSLIHPPLS